jgi:predicted transcriptional regulator of viral defense system
MKVQRFLARHPVFRHEEFATFLAAEGTRSPRTRDALLAYHLDAGHLLRIRRGLYAAVPLGFAAEHWPVDPYLIAAHATEDAVLAYHAALQFHGKAHALHQRHPYLTRHTRRPFTFRDQTFVAVPFPKALRARKAERFDVLERPHAGGTVRVTTLERTLVDVLARPDLGGGWEEAWRSLESIEFFDLDRVVDYTLRLASATVVAKVGFYLAQHREALMVEDRHLDRLRARAPRQPRYLERHRRAPGHLVAPWNLVVPVDLLERRWAEVA